MEVGAAFFLLVEPRLSTLEVLRASPSDPESFLAPTCSPRVYIGKHGPLTVGAGASLGPSVIPGQRRQGGVAFPGRTRV